MVKTHIKLYMQKTEGMLLCYDEYNSKKFLAFDDQLSPGCFEVDIKKSKQPKTLEQLGYWYGGIIEGMIEQIQEQGHNILGYKDYGDDKVPLMVNKVNCDDYLKAVYMISIGKPLEKFGKRDSSVIEMSALIDWTLDYLLHGKWQVYIPSPEEYKRQIGK